MNALLPALTAIALLATPIPALTAPEEAPPKAAVNPANEAANHTDTPKAEDTLLPPPPKVTRWEDTGMKPAEAQEWQHYEFKPQEAMNWRDAGFVPLVARTWSDKGFDASEAQAWRDSVRNSRSLMAELDHTDPGAWKREGFSPADRLAWWESGFTFDEARLLARSGMTPAQAAWHGQEKLKELRGETTGSAAAPNNSASSPKAPPPELSAAGIWKIVGPFLKFGLIVLAVLMAVVLAVVLYRRRQVNKKLAKSKPNAPDTEAPSAEPKGVVPHRRKPARAVSMFRRAHPRCIHCQSKDVRPSRMHPHKFAGINFTDYFRCKACGRHFAIVSYTTIVLAGGGIALSLLLLVASIIYMSNVG